MPGVKISRTARAAWDWCRLSQGGKAELLSRTSRHRTDKIATAFLASCRSEYELQGWCHIPGFLPAATVEAMRSEASELLSNSNVAFESSDRHTVYQEEQDLGAYACNHPRNKLMTSQKKIVDFAKISAASPLKALYHTTELLQFVQYVVGVPQLYPSACPFNAAMYNGYYEGHGLGWHFDRSQFGVNLVLAEPDEGGAFDYHRQTRGNDANANANANANGDDAWAYKTVGTILSASESSSPLTNLQTLGVESVPGVRAGSLVFFSGRNSLHRVSPVVGQNPRINCILTYEEQPGQKANAYSLGKFFGRTEAEQDQYSASNDTEL